MHSRCSLLLLVGKDYQADLVKPAPSPPIAQLLSLVPHHLFSIFPELNQIIKSRSQGVKTKTWSGILHVVEAAEAAVADIQSVPPNAGTCPPGAGIGSEPFSYRCFSVQKFEAPCCAGCVDIMLPDPTFWRDDFYYYRSIFVCFPCRLVYYLIIFNVKESILWWSGMLVMFTIRRLDLKLLHQL